MGRSKKANQAIAMLRMEFHPDLSFEVKTSYDWYEDKADGLGDDFLTEVELGLQAIIEYPDTWPVFAKKSPGSGLRYCSYWGVKYRVMGCRNRL